MVDANVIGGPGMRVQLDETIIARSGHVASPTGIADDVGRSVWLFVVLKSQITEDSFSESSLIGNQPHSQRLYESV